MSVEQPLVQNHITLLAEKEALKKKKAGLTKALILSVGIDIAVSVFEMPLAIQFLGAPILIDEIVEYFISKWIASGAIELKTRNKVLGLIPIPGVTAVSLRCASALWKLRKEEKRLSELEASIKEEW